MKAYRMLPAARVGVGARPPFPVMVHRGFGDVTAADTALQAMVTDIAQNGCQQTPQASVSQFQTAYNAWITPGGGVNPIKVDGLYGSNTESAANFVNTTDGLNLTIPAGCVAQAPTTGATTSSSPSTSSSNVTVNAASPYTPYIVAGAVVATGLVGFAMWHHQSAGGTRRVARRATHLRPMRHAHR